MNILLIFFAIPIAVIILSIILQTYMRSPLKVAGIFFSIFLVIAFFLGGAPEFIVAVIVYTLISLISAYITEFIQSRRCHRRETFSNEYREDVVRNLEPEFELPATVDETTFNTEFNNGNNYCRRYR